MQIRVRFVIVYLHAQRIYQNIIIVKYYGNRFVWFLVVRTVTLWMALLMTWGWCFARFTNKESAVVAAISASSLLNLFQLITINTTWQASGNDWDPPWFRVSSYPTPYFPFSPMIYSVQNSKTFVLKIILNEIIVYKF